MEFLAALHSSSLVTQTEWGLFACSRTRSHDRDAEPASCAHHEAPDKISRGDAEARRRENTERNFTDFFRPQGSGGGSWSQCIRKLKESFP